MLRIATGFHPQPTTISPKISSPRTHNGKEIVPDGTRVRVVSQPDGTHALLIDKAAAADAGKYGVVAINDKGEIGSSADLTVASEYLFRCFIEELLYSTTKSVNFTSPRVLLM